MKVNLKRILKSLPFGSQNLIFYKLDEVSRDIKEKKTGADRKIWILAYNLSYFSENQPIRRYIAYDENPQNYKLDQGLLPYVKVIHAYARLSETQKQQFQTEVQSSEKSLKTIHALRCSMANQNG